MNTFDILYCIFIWPTAAHIFLNKLLCFRKLMLFSVDRTPAFCDQCQNAILAFIICYRGLTRPGRSATRPQNVVDASTWTSRRRSSQERLGVLQGKRGRSERRTQGVLIPERGDACIIRVFCSQNAKTRALSVTVWRSVRASRRSFLFNIYVTTYESRTYDSRLRT